MSGEAGSGEAGSGGTFTLAVIPARAGSKGLPGKNIRPLLGKPLLAWSVEAALAAKGVDRVVVSTDGAEIAAVARAFGAEVLDRPARLATDEATTIATLGHVAEHFPGADPLVVLQPTSPLRDPGLIDECLAAFHDGDWDDLATGYMCTHRPFGEHNNARRQDHPGFFHDDGNVYVLKRRLVAEGRWFGERIRRHLIARHQNFEIDDEIDFMLLERLMERHGRAEERGAGGIPR